MDRASDESTINEMVADVTGSGRSIPAVEIKPGDYVAYTLRSLMTKTNHEFLLPIKVVRLVDDLEFDGLTCTGNVYRLARRFFESSLTLQLVNEVLNNERRVSDADAGGETTATEL